MQNKIVVITGGSSGIGEQIAYKFAKHGYAVAITCYDDPKSSQAVIQTCLKLGAQEAIALSLKLEDNNSINELAGQIVDKYGKIGILINNAGRLNYEPLLDQAPAEIELQVKSNMEGPIKLTQKCLPYITSSIINIGSNIIYYPKRNMSVYSAAKAGIAMFGRCLAKEYPDLLIYTVHPILTATKMGKPEGMPPQKVSEIVYKAATGQIKKPSGADINMRDYKYDHQWKNVIYNNLRKIKHL